MDGVESMDQLKDVYSHFMLYYRNDIPAMWEAKRKKNQAEGDAADEQPDNTSPPKQKMPAKRDLYTICKQAGTLPAMVFTSLPRTLNALLADYTPNFCTNWHFKLYKKFDSDLKSPHGCNEDE